MKQKFATGWIFFLGFVAFVMLTSVTLLSDDNDDSSDSSRQMTEIPGTIPSVAVKYKSVEVDDDDNDDDAGVVAEIGSKESDRLMMFASERVVNVHGRPTLVVVYVSSTYALIVLNFVAALLRLQITNYMIVCTDKQVAYFLQSRGQDCFLADLSRKQSSSVAEQPITTARNLGKTSLKAKQQLVARIKRVWILRATHLSQLLHAGIDVVFSDADAMWVRNPFETGLFTTATGDVVAGRGKYPWNVAEAWGAALCMGVVFFRSCPAVNTLADEIVADVQRSKDDQKSLNNILMRWGGMKPAPLFGSRISIHDRQMHSALITKPLAIRDKKGNKVASGGKPLQLRLVLAAHSVIPRFCNIVPKEEWNGLLQIAHCHTNDGKVKRTMSNWGKSDVRISAMQVYKLWCLSDAWLPVSIDKDKKNIKKGQQAQNLVNNSLAILDKIVPGVESGSIEQFHELLVRASETACPGGTGISVRQ